MVILFDQFNLPNNIFEIIFATEQQAIAAKLLVKELKEHKEGMGRELMSLFATKLHEGKFLIVIREAPIEGLPSEKVRVSYNKRQFYDRILTPMRTMGLIDYDMYKRTYKLSDSFNKILAEIGRMWAREIKN